jgi:hypothetical protein
METFCNGLLNTGYKIWNMLVGSIAWGLFKQSPKDAFVNEYGVSFYTDVIQKVFKTITDIMVPLLMLFFIMKLFKELISTPWEQFYKKAIYSVLHFIVISFICFNLWTINGVFIDCTQSVANAMFKGLEGYVIEGDHYNTKPINEDDPHVYEAPDIIVSGADIQMVFEDNEDPVLGAAIEQLDGEDWIVRAIGWVVIMLGCAGAALAWGSSAIMILKAAYTRLLKPLIMLPFSGLAVAMSAGTENMARTTYAFYKQIAIFILAGPFMGICMAIAKFLTIDIPADSETKPITAVLLIIATMIIRPMIIAGLVKEASNTIQQFT